MEKRNRQKFWLCMVDDTTEYYPAPKHRHYDMDKATKEAERLAKETGNDVFLLAATWFVRYTPPVVPPEIQWKETLC